MICLITYQLEDGVFEWRHWPKNEEGKSSLFFVREGCKIDLAIKAKCNVHIVALYLEGH